MAAKFIQLTDRTWISADRIGSIRHAPDHHGWLLFDHNGSELGEAAGPWFNPQIFDDEPVVMPAVPGEVVAVLHFANDLDHRPERTDVMVARCALVAWRVWESGWAEPILAGEPRTRAPSLTLLQRPDGRLAGGDDDYANLAEATTAFLRESQEEWNQRDEGGTDRGETEPPARMH